MKKSSRVSEIHLIEFLGKDYEGSNADFENGVSLYVGIPYCPSTCMYCSFPSYPLAGAKGQVGRYLDALLKELEDADSDFNALGMDIIKKKAKSFYYRRYQGFNTMVVRI